MKNEKKKIQYSAVSVIELREEAPLGSWELPCSLIGGQASGRSDTFFDSLVDEVTLVGMSCCLLWNQLCT